MRRESLRVSFENENEKIGFSKFLTLGTNTFVFLARKFCAFLKIKKRKEKEEKEKRRGRRGRGEKLARWIDYVRWRCAGRRNETHKERDDGTVGLLKKARAS